MESKFEAVIDLEAQPFTSALQGAISGLQTLAAELEKANTTLNQAADGMNKSAAAADGVGAASAGAAESLSAEASAAKSAAEAHEKHADAANKGASAASKNSAQLRDMHASTMLAASALRSMSELARNSGNEGVATSLSAAGSMLNVLSMKSMMGVEAAGAMALFEAIPYAYKFTDNFWNGDDRRSGQEKAKKIGSDFSASQMRQQIDDAKTLNDVLQIQKSIKDDLAQTETAMKQLNATNLDHDKDAQIGALKVRLDLLKKIASYADQQAPKTAQSEISAMLAAFDKNRQGATGEAGYQLSLINADSEKEKIRLVGQEIERLQKDAQAKMAAARAGTDPEAVKKLLAEASASLASVDSLTLQKAEMTAGKKGSGKDLPEQAYNDPQVDSFWKRGLMMGSGSTPKTDDTARRQLSATEKMERHTEQMVALIEKLTPNASWSN